MDRRPDYEHWRRRSKHSSVDGGASPDEDYPYASRMARTPVSGEDESARATPLPSWTPLHASHEQAGSTPSGYSITVGRRRDAPSVDPRSSNPPPEQAGTPPENPWASGSYSRWYPSSSDPSARRYDFDPDAESDASDRRIPPSGPHHPERPDGQRRSTRRDPDDGNSFRTEYESDPRATTDPGRRGPERPGDHRRTHDARGDTSHRYDAPPQREAHTDPPYRDAYDRRPPLETYDDASHGHDYDGPPQQEDYGDTPHRHPYDAPASTGDAARPHPHGDTAPPHPHEAAYAPHARRTTAPPTDEHERWRDPEAPRDAPAAAWHPHGDTAPALPSAAPLLPAHMARPLYPATSPTDTKKAIAEKVEAVRRGKWYILVLFILAVGCAYAYVETVTPTYEAFSLVMIDTRPGPDVRGPSFDVSSEPALSSRNVPNQALILGQSLLIAERTVQRLLDLRELPETGEGLSLLAHARENASPRELAERLQRDYVQVAPATDRLDADGIRITAAGPVASEVALIANLYAEEYVALARESSQRDVVATREYLEQQVEQRRIELFDLENEIETYVSAEGAISIANDAGRITAQISQLENDLDHARIEVSMREASVTSLEHELDQLQPRMVDRIASGAEQERQQVQAELTDLEARLEVIFQRNPELRERPEDNPSLRQMLSRRENLRARVRELSERYVDELYAAGGVDATQQSGGLSYVAELRRELATERVALSGAQARARAMEQRLGEYRRRMNSLPVQTSQLEKLRRDKDSVERQYLDLVQRLQEARIREEGTQSFAQIIRPASMPDHPVHPRKAVTMSLGGLLGLLLGFGGAFARHRLDSRLYGPDDLRQTDVPLLGTVPDMSVTIQREIGRSAMTGGPAGLINASLVSYMAPLSPEAEAYRRLLANVQFKGIRQNVKSLLVTSPDMGAGKTVTAINLAVTSAQSGRRTLILDADMHRPTLHLHLGFPQDPRRTRMLFEGRVPVRIDEMRTGIHNLYALSLRDLIAVPGELLASHEMRSLIARLRSVFDVIVFDSPPVLAASDASILSAHADATILVAASGSTSREDLDAAVNELRGIGARVYGAVLNRFNPDRGRMSYGGGAYPYRTGARRRLFF